MQTNERPSRAKTILWSVAGTLAMLVLILLIVPYTGAVSVAATQPDLPGMQWFLETTQERSVASRSAAIEPPSDLAAPRRIERGLESFHEMCAGCHGAPGIEPGWMAQGLNPEPPPLWKTDAREISNGQAARDYWVIENGIRMTGMPALGPTHDEQEIWDLVAIVQQLPEMSATAYASAVRDAGLSLETTHEHPEDEEPMGTAGEEPGGHPHDDDHSHED
jgi:mono/diheme cytochrome c family protein